MSVAVKGGYAVRIGDKGKKGEVGMSTRSDEG